MAEINDAFPGIQKGEDLVETLIHVSKATGEKFIMIIDEWDALFREAKDDAGLQKEYIDFLRSLFKSNWTDMIFAGAYMTGILPIKKYGTQSAMTDFREYSMLMPGKLAKYVGFTESEVKELCRQYGMDFESMKRWYDGYSFSRLKSVYNPNSVVEAISREEFGSYWTRTETYESLKLYIDLDFDGLKEAITQMLGGAHIRIDAETFQNDMTEIRSRDNVLTLLIHLGYLAYDSDNASVFVPNEEIRREFIRAVTSGKHTEIAKLIRNSEQLLDATLDMDEETVAEIYAGSAD